MRIALACSLAALLLAGSAGAQTIQVDRNNRTLEVTATGSASAVADEARISIGFEVYAPDAKAAYQRGAQLSNAIIDAVKKAGAAEKDIQSASQNLSRTSFPYGDATPPEDRAQRQFTLSQSWTVTTPAELAATVLRAAIEAGANDSGNIGWELSSRDALQAKAAEKALVQARAIAAQMAAGLGVQLGPLIYASNQAAEQPSWILTAPRIHAMRQAPPPLALSPRQVRESATVRAVFAIE